MDLALASSTRGQASSRNGLRRAAAAGLRGGGLATRKGEAYQMGMELPASYGVTRHLQFPDWWFGITPRATAEYRIPPLPATVPVDSKQGDIVGWEGKRMVVLEVNRRPGVDVMHLVPPEVIDVAG